MTSSDLTTMPPPTIRVFEAISEELTARIRAGRWLPGARLPSIAALSRELGASAGSVREALRSLQTRGLVRMEHGRGTFVNGAPPAHGLPDAASTSLGMIVALTEARRIIEPELAAMAAERGSHDERTEILLLAEQMHLRASSGDDFLEPDMQFHRQIARAARNPVLLRMMESMADLFVESRRLTTAEPGMTPRAVRYHLLIAEAINERNADQARLLMMAHMNDALSSILAREGHAGQ
jgi:GntR family transcriptional repressor for pyruvate dehydrogenase complex